MIQFCRLCSTEIGGPIFTGLIFESTVKYFECRICGYVQTERPYWLEKAYSSVISNFDTGIMARNQSNVGLILATLSVNNIMTGVVVDYAGGYGILVRLLRDRGIEALWSDPYAKNLVAVGFEHTTQRAELVTAFEVFEHFTDPLLEANKLFAIAPNLLISTILIDTPAPLPDRWWYYGLEHGQHVGFFRLQTLEFIAKKFNKYLVSDGVSCHMFTDKPVNSYAWKLKASIGRRLPFLFGRKLKSKTQSDFARMSKTL